MCNACCLSAADPFKSAALPEVIEEYLEYGIAKSCAFNRRGTLLASKQSLLSCISYT